MFGSTNVDDPEELIDWVAEIWRAASCVTRGPQNRMGGLDRLR
jgi:hypothetical protein